MNIHRCRFVDWEPAVVTTLAFSDAESVDTLRLAAGRANGDIEIYDPRYNWALESSIKGGSGRSIESMAWCKGLLYTTGGSTTVVQWDLLLAVPMNQYTLHSIVWCIASNGSNLAAGCDDGAVVVLSAEGDQKLLQRQPSRVLSITWIDHRIAGGCADGRIRVWDSQTGHIIATMTADRPSRDEDIVIWSIKTLEDGNIATGDSTGAVSFWNTTHYTLMQVFRNHKADVLTLATSGSTLYSAGVDKIIQCYTKIDRKWAQTNSRLLHGHDVRALSLYESPSLKTLVSGGVERSIVISSADPFEFAQGLFRRIPISPQRPIVSVNQSKRLIVLWYESTVTIWGLGADAEHKSYRKLVLMQLNTEEFITHAALSLDASLLAVATALETKLYKLKWSSNSPAPEILKADLPFDHGAKLVALVGSAQHPSLILVTEASDVLRLPAPGADRPGTLDVISDEQNDPSNPINIIATGDNDLVAVGRLSGTIDVYSGARGRHVCRVPGLGAMITSLSLQQNLLVAITAEMSIVEYDTSSKSFTKWSNRNADVVPEELRCLVDKCLGIFYTKSKPELIWLWGANWMAYIDKSSDFALEEGRNPLKRKRDRRNESSDAVSSAGQGKGYWITYKYRNILCASSLSADELVVVERPSFDIKLPRSFWTKKVAVNGA
ncbi:hypothetical protein CANCADRAFT_52449 [Tortispora caseinolytica NRRL Y-17796]|uniref:Uncharacterized protein n=1 Tax=Tortispora caseinolytica NRRL Y-17796 TaxID=767744 RepID=A0A1E4T9V0_9ASCO|nr:hypothetical protein CANCADRAFT_52449 [Tortispora caseinolytica NRRL Y-17796]